MAIFNKIPWTNFHDLNLEWIVKHLKVIEQKVDQIVSDHDAVVALQSAMMGVENKLDKIPLPSASDVGKVLGAVADGAGAKLEYVAQTGGGVPTPAAGDSGKVLKAGSDGTYSWQDETACPVPTPGSGDSGKVLTAGSGGAMSWQTAPGGGGSGSDIRFAYVTYAQVFVDDTTLCTPTTYKVLTQIAADMNAARAVSRDAMKEVYNRVKIRINGRTLPPDSLGWDSSATYTTSSERFLYRETEEAQTVRVSGSFKRVLYRGAEYHLYLPINGGTPALEYQAPTGYADLTGGTLTPVTGVTALDDRMAERMIVEIEYDRAT